MRFNIKGRVSTEIKDKDGNTLKKKDWGENVITNVGLAGWTARAGDVGGITPFKYLGLGKTGTPEDASQTQLTNEFVGSGLARAEATATQETDTITNDTLRLEYEWTASNTETVREIGVFNAIAGGLMSARKTVNDEVQASETYRVVYDITISRI